MIFRINRFARCCLIALPLLAGDVVLAAPPEPVPDGITERDYFSEMPVVLSVSRLAQPLDETPGAVTVIDRDMIRKSGAREPAELLRLVPGFLVGGFNGANPVASYHGAFNMYGTHLQVLVDGRSVYSTFFLGDTHRGLMGLVLEDIERIEVLRGSNSAAYGANAFLGVVNIITRNAADTRGGMVSVTGGEGGIADNVARVGFGNERASFRATLSRRADSGLDNLYDDQRVGQLNLRGDLRPSLRDEVLLLAGTMSNSWGDGLPGSQSNAERTGKLESAYAHGSWRRDLDRWGELKLSASWDEERYRDRWSYADALAPLTQAFPPFGTLVVLPVGAYAATALDFSGSARRLGVEAQHQFHPAERVRLVWGGAYHHEQVKSPPLYYLTDTISSNQWRWFGNIEWRPHERLVLNAGGLWEKDSMAGSRWAPRLAGNFHISSNHTFRAGITRAHRTPTLYEQRGDTRFFDTAPYLAGAEASAKSFPFWALVPAAIKSALETSVFAPVRANTVPYGSGHYLGGVMLANSVRATGDASPETILSREVGYLGQFPALRLTIDVRAFDERIGNMVRQLTYAKLGALGMDTVDFADSQGPHIFGWEHQTRWQPWSGTRLMLSQSFMRIHSPEASDTLNEPTEITSVAWFQELPGDFNASAIYATTGAMSWRGTRDLLKSEHQVNLRLAKQFRIGPTKGEVAWTVQQANGPRQEFLPTYTLDRRAYATLRLEY